MAGELAEERNHLGDGDGIDAIGGEAHNDVGALEPVGEEGGDLGEGDVGGGREGEVLGGGVESVGHFEIDGREIQFLMSKYVWKKGWPPGLEKRCRKLRRLLRISNGESFHQGKSTI